MGSSIHDVAGSTLPAVCDVRAPAYGRRGSHFSVRRLAADSQSRASLMPFQPEILWGVGTIVLFVVLIYGMIQYKTRNRGNDRVSDAATKALYDDPERYPEKREALKQDIKPS
jgi:hypothetical protein